MQYFPRLLTRVTFSFAGFLLWLKPDTFSAIPPRLESRGNLVLQLTLQILALHSHSQLNSHSRFTTYSQLTTHNSHSQLTTHNSQLTTHNFYFQSFSSHHYYLHSILIFSTHQSQCVNSILYMLWYGNVNFIFAHIL